MMVFPCDDQCSGKIIRIVYLCAACKKYERFFLLQFTDDYLMKVGQYPPWEITPDKNLTELLADYKDYYEKGLVCESQSYGIGAYAYYRRILEAIIDSLLNSVADLIAESERQRYLTAFEEAKKTTIAQEKMKLVKDLLPETLRPDGMNPRSRKHVKNYKCPKKQFGTKRGHCTFLIISSGVAERPFRESFLSYCRHFEC